MLFKMHLCLAAVFITALASLGFSKNNYCTTIQWGDSRVSRTVPYNLTTVRLLPEVRDQSVVIQEHQHPYCQLSMVVGLRVVVCDFDATPDAKFMEQFNVFVHRTGAVEEVGTVNITAYCPRYGPGRSGNAFLTPANSS